MERRIIIPLEASISQTSEIDFDLKRKILENCNNSLDWEAPCVQTQLILFESHQNPKQRVSTVRNKRRTIRYFDILSKRMSSSVIPPKTDERTTRETTLDIFAYWFRFQSTSHGSKFDLGETERERERERKEGCTKNRSLTAIDKDVETTDENRTTGTSIELKQNSTCIKTREQWLSMWRLNSSSWTEITSFMEVYRSVQARLTSPLCRLFETTALSCQENREIFCGRVLKRVSICKGMNIPTWDLWSVTARNAFYKRK